MSKTVRKHTIEYQVVSQLFTSLSILHVLPNEIKLGEFIVEAMLSIPGVKESSMCLRAGISETGTAELETEELMNILMNIPFDQNHFDIDIKCNEKRLIFPLKTTERSFGYLYVYLDGKDAFEKYRPAVNNLVNFLAVDLENRWQKAQLLDNKILLEERVANRTKELRAEKWTAAQNNEPYDIEHRLLVDGKVKWVREKADLQFDKDGKAITAIGFTQDISFRKEAEVRIKESEEKFSKAFFNHPTPMQMLNMDTGYRIAVNESFSKLMGVKSEELIATNLFDGSFWKYPEELIKAKELLLKDGKITNLPIEIITKSGDTRNLIVSSSLIDVPGENIAVAALVDVTDQKRTENELKLTLRQLEILKNKIKEEKTYLEEEIKQQHNFTEIIGNTEVVLTMLKQIELVATTDSAVLILGETGTGKELVARAIHNSSNRTEHPLVKVNCPALPAELIESELFGHEKGAYTGAFEKKIGRFELADQGTIFLDEIGDLPLTLQVKLLRVLQEGEFEKVGSPHTQKVDARIIAATNRDLEQLVLDGKFRQDLYFRLKVFPITSPNLKERKEDIPILINHFVKKLNPKMGKNIKSIPQKTIDKLQKYHWPGNVRELENIIERAMIFNQGRSLYIGDWFDQTAPTTDKINLRTLAELEKEYILDVLKKTRWRIRGKYGAAQILGLKPTTLESRMKKLDIKRQDN